jgi:tetratricopeptide (TPR) repeat protein
MSIAARKLSLEGKLTEAAALYQRAIDRDPKLFDAQYGIGLVLDLEGRYAQAREHLKTAIALAPPGAEELALEAMGVSHAFEADAAGAAPSYTRLFDEQIQAGNLAGAAATANALGRVYLESGDPAHAKTWYQRGYDTAMKQADMPARERGLWQMRLDHAEGRIAARAGDEPTARRHVAAVKKIVDEPGNADQMPDYEYLVGYVAFYTGHPAEAIAALKQANQKDAFILGLLAQAYEKQGHAAAARETWQRVLAINSHDIQNAFSRPLARKALSSQ